MWMATDADFFCNYYITRLLTDIGLFLSKK